MTDELSGITVTARLFGRVREWLLTIDDVPDTIFRGYPATEPSLPAIRMYTRDRSLVLHYDSYIYTTQLVLDIQSTSADQLDKIELAVVNTVLENKGHNNLYNTLSDDQIGIYEFYLSGIEEDIYVESREQDGRIFIVRPVVFSVGYYQTGSDYIEKIGG